MVYLGCKTTPFDKGLLMYMTVLSANINIGMSWSLFMTCAMELLKSLFLQFTRAAY